ncbi:MAG: RnfABCDGE type electron transport complex subunit G [Pontiellaceae bacterium]|jgi:electron transport complex protein RnfG|nr:RnfABCDGE type electron transport complex subunit G [Pontiellaceae bacterium]
MSNDNVKITPLVVRLGLISCVASTLLAWVYLKTEEPIAAALKQKTNSALSEVLPAFDNQPVEEAVKVGKVTFYVARKDGAVVGFVGETVSNKGYGGEITVLAGLQPDGTITTVLVTKQTETPGLGTVVCSRTREKTLTGILAGKKETGLPPNRILDQFAGMKAAAGQTPWAVKKDGGDLDAVTGATITSRAVGDAVFTVAETFAQNSKSLLTDSH